MIWGNSTTNKEMIVEAAEEGHLEVEDEEVHLEPGEANSEHPKYSFNLTDCLEYLSLEDLKIP